MHTYKDDFPSHIWCHIPKVLTQSDMAEGDDN